MIKILDKIKGKWKDPVWSKVIAGVIFPFIVSFYTFLCSIIKNTYKQIHIDETSFNSYKLMTSNVTLPLWELTLLIIIIAFGILLITPNTAKLIWNLILIIWSKIQSKIRRKTKDKLPKAIEHSTSFFSNRMAKAFPGIRGVTWFDNPKEINRRLKILLSQPLEFSPDSRLTESDPIWWFRGGSSLHINKFKKNGSNKFLLNIDELKIKRIAVFHSPGRYYGDYVYVEVSEDRPTGLYKHKKDVIEYLKQYSGYYNEEYAIFKYLGILRKKISREEYDDGATMICGQIVNTFGSELRSRYLTDYNFIIASKGSPYNSDNFSQNSLDYFNGILQGTKSPEEFFNYLDSLPKRQY